jgi:hypothetical protein
MRTPAEARARDNYYASNKGRHNRRTWDASYRDKIKIYALTLCGDGCLKCCWSGCDITDPDMLSIDHVYNDGKLNRRETGNTLYRKIKREGNLDGRFQTLCHNHQWKKELLRRRSLMQIPF